MKFNLIGSTVHLNISSGNAAHYIIRLDIPDVEAFLAFILKTSPFNLFADTRLPRRTCTEIFNNVFNHSSD